MQNDSNQRQLSKWLRPLTKVHTNFGEAAASLQRFFADHANFKVPPRAAKPAASQPRDLAFFGSGRAGAAGSGGGGPRPGALGSGAPDPLLSSLANVPAAADTSGLPGLPGYLHDCSSNMKPVSLHVPPCPVCICGWLCRNGNWGHSVCINFAHGFGVEP